MSGVKLYEGFVFSFLSLLSFPFTWRHGYSKQWPKRTRGSGWWFPPGHRLIQFCSLRATCVTDFNRDMLLHLWKHSLSNHFASSTRATCSHCRVYLTHVYSAHEDRFPGRWKPRKINISSHSLLQTETIMHSVLTSKFTWSISFSHSWSWYFTVLVVLHHELSVEEEARASFEFW